MKPDWKDAPEWAEFLALDGDGEWYWFEREPLLSEATAVWRVDSGRTELAAVSCSTILERRP